MICPTCHSTNVLQTAYSYHRLSFAQRGFRNPFPKKRELQACHQCSHIWSDSSYVNFDTFSLPETFHHPRYNIDSSQVQSEKYFANRLISVLRKFKIASADSILDLRMLSGRLLDELKQTYPNTTTIGFDWHELTCQWAQNQYGHSVKQYPPGDPFIRLDRLIKESPDLIGHFDLVVQSQSILESTKRPREFAKLIFKLLSPRGVWAIYEQFIDMFPKNIFLHELFDPWTMQYFSWKSFQQVFLESNVNLTIGFETSTRRLVLAGKTDSQFNTDMLEPKFSLEKHPRYELCPLDNRWIGWPGKIRTTSKKYRYKIEDRIGLHYNRFRTLKLETSNSFNFAPIHIDLRPTIDILVVSCGRTKALQKTMKHFQQMCRSEDYRLRFLIHDDWIDARSMEHNQCRKWIKESKLFDEIHLAEQNRGISQSVNLLLSRLESDVYVHLEDDMVFIRPVALDPLFRIFKNYKLVNQIRFNRTENRPLVGSVSKIFGKYRARMFRFDDTILTMGSFWANQPNISRSDSPFTRLMNSNPGRFHERVFNVKFAEHWLDPIDTYNQLGTFMYGPIRYGQIVYEADSFSPHLFMKPFFPEDNSIKIDD